MEDKKKKSRLNSHIAVPDTMVILFALIIIAMILTWVVPAGTFDYVLNPESGREVVVPGTFHTTEKSPVFLMGMLTSVQRGMIDVAYIMGLMFLVGGCFGVLTESGAIKAGIQAGIKKVGTGKKSLIIIPVVLIIISGMASFLGSMESLIAFIPISIAACRALGYDRMTGIGLVLTAICVGSAGTAMSPYSVVAAQAIAGLPTYSGMEVRIASWVVMLVIAIVFIGIYATKVKKNPIASLTYDDDKDATNDILNEDADFSGPKKLALIVFGLGIIYMILGVVLWGYGSTQIAGIYFGIGILAGIVLRLDANTIVNYFVKGAKDMLYAALIVGISRAVTIILSDGQVINTIINAVSNAVEGLSPAVGSVVMLIFQCIANIFIPSGSGQAAVTMPLMAPLADLIGITRQTAVLAFVYGDALTNVTSPTVGWFMAALAMGGVSFGKWMKWFWKMFLAFVIVCVVFVVYAALTQLGPF